MGTQRFRAYCDDPLCAGWTAADSWGDEENAWTDYRAHLDDSHGALAGVRQEST